MNRSAPWCGRGLIPAPEPPGALLPGVSLALLAALARARHALTEELHDPGNVLLYGGGFNEDVIYTRHRSLLFDSLNNNDRLGFRLVSLPELGAHVMAAAAVFALAALRRVRGAKLGL